MLNNGPKNIRLPIQGGSCRPKTPERRRDRFGYAGKRCDSYRYIRTDPFLYRSLLGLFKLNL